MKRYLKLMLAVTAMALMMLPLSSCAQKAEAADFNGTLSNAMDNEIVVKSEDGTLTLFTTDDDTTYNTGGEGHFSIDDKIYVKYHEKGKKKVAEEVILREHAHKSLTFGGRVSDLKDDSITVTGKSLTVTFTRNNNTLVAGDLSRADEVEITYTGDINDYPYASEIKVISENREPEKVTVSGIVSELADSTVLLGITSATSYRFRITKDTKIAGASDKLSVGDSVNVTYSGDIEKTPDAVSINIVKKAQIERHTINGKIKKTAKTSVTLDTGKKTYKFVTDKNTKFNGDKPAEGYKSEITYTGELGKDPVAVIVYCVKETPAPAPAPTPTPEEPVQAKGTLTAWVSAGNNTCKVNVDGTGELTLTVDEGVVIPAGYFPEVNDIVNITYMKSSMVLRKIELAERPAPTPEEPVSAHGTLASWTSEGNSSCRVITDEGEDLTLIVDPAGLDIPDGYMPQANDVVDLTYIRSDMKLRSIKLDSRPEAEPDKKDSSEQAETDKKDSSEQAEADKKDSSDQAEPEKKDEPEQQTEPETTEAAPAAEPAPDPDVIIEAQGVLTAGDEAKMTAVVNIDGKDVELSGNKDTKISSGYFPEQGDTVRVVYNKNGMVLKEIQLISRAEPASGDAPVR